MTDYPIVLHARKIGKNTRDWNMRDMLSFLRTRYPINRQPMTPRKPSSRKEK